MYNVIENARKHLGHTILFILFLILGITLFLAFAHDPRMRLILLAIVSVAYAVWSIVHHYMRKDLSWGIVIEYSIVSLIAILWVISLLGWGTL
ncbi:MAG: hypothetical protein M3Q44_07425 [bacterium]|nr:hypothetical protein [bacterium]